MKLWGNSWCSFCQRKILPSIGNIEWYSWAEAFTKCFSQALWLMFFLPRYVPTKTIHFPRYWKYLEQGGKKRDCIYLKIFWSTSEVSVKYALLTSRFFPLALKHRDFNFQRLTLAGKNEKHQRNYRGERWSIRIKILHNRLCWLISDLYSKRWSTTRIQTTVRAFYDSICNNLTIFSCKTTFFHLNRMHEKITLSYKPSSSIVFDWVYPKVGWHAEHAIENCPRFCTTYYNGTLGIVFRTIRSSPRKVKHCGLEFLASAFQPRNIYC